MARRRRRTQWLSAVLLGFAATAAAGAPPVAPVPNAAARTPAPKDVAPEPAPDAELLLYLSEFEDAQGGFVDPAELPAAELPPVEDDDDAP